MRFEQKLYEIACLFPTLKCKGVMHGNIPGIRPDRFCANELKDFLCNGGGGAWSTGEVLALEFLLNLYDPSEYKAFNLGKAVNVWDSSHMKACFMAMTKIYNGE